MRKRLGGAGLRRALPRFRMSLNRLPGAPPHSKERRKQHQGRAQFFPPQPPPLGTAESVDVRRADSAAGRVARAMSKFWRVDTALEDSEGLWWIRKRLEAFDWSKADWISVRRGR